MPHLYVAPLKIPERHWCHDQRDSKLFRAMDGEETFFIRLDPSGKMIRLSLLTTNIDLLLNRHKRILYNFARRMNAEILKSNLGNFLKDERGLFNLWNEKKIASFDWNTPSPKHLEIGSGNGMFLNAQAKRNPHCVFIGTEINGFVLKKALRTAATGSLSNVFYLRKEARYLLRYLIPENILDAIHIYFPDPWSKTRHHKRKLIQPTTIENFARCLKHGGSIFFTSDDVEYATEAKELFEKSPCFNLKTYEMTTSPKIYTKYEKKWITEGRIIYSLSLQRNDFPSPPSSSDTIIESFTLLAPHRLKSDTIFQKDDFTVIFRDVYRGEDEDLIDAIVTLGRTIWFVLFSWREGKLHFSSELNQKFLSRRVETLLRHLFLA